MMSSGVKQVVRTALAVLVVLAGGARATYATQIPIGSFGWVELAPTGQDEPVQYTLEVLLFDFPSGLALTNVSASYTRPSGSGTAYFAGTGTSCVGAVVTVDATNPSYQSPGLFGPDPGTCDSQFNPLAPLPQDITSATLNFSYNTALGLVEVAMIGPAVPPPPFVPQDDFDEPPPGIERSTAIYFTAAAPPTSDPAVPEPASMVLLGTGLTALVARRRRRTR